MILNVYKNESYESYLESSTIYNYDGSVSIEDKREPIYDNGIFVGTICTSCCAKSEKCLHSTVKIINGLDVQENEIIKTLHTTRMTIRNKTYEKSRDMVWNVDKFKTLDKTVNLLIDDKKVLSYNFKYKQDTHGELAIANGYYESGNLMFEIQKFSESENDVYIINVYDLLGNKINQRIVTNSEAMSLVEGKIYNLYTSKANDMKNSFEYDYKIIEVLTTPIIKNIKE